MMTDEQLEELRGQRFNENEEIIHALVEEVISLRFELHFQEKSDER